MWSYIAKKIGNNGENEIDVSPLTVKDAKRMMGSGPKPTQQRMTFKQMKQQNKASTTLIEQQDANQQDDFVPQTQYANTSLE